MRTSESRSFEVVAAGDSATWWKVSRGLTTGNPVGERVEDYEWPNQVAPVHPMRKRFEEFEPVRFMAAACPKSRSVVRTFHLRLSVSVLEQFPDAQQGARANASGRHAACDVTSGENETAESET